MDIKTRKILVTGGAGFLGRCVVSRLLSYGVPREHIFIPRSKEFDLRERSNCERVASGMNVVIHLAAKVGGIGFNKENPGELFYDNIVMGTQMIEAAHRAGVQKFVALGTICAYPKFTPVPFHEDHLWNGYPEETNAPYGLAKKALLIQAQAYRKQHNFNVVYLLPVNLYGPGDTFDPSRSHVIPALIKKVADAKRRGEPYVEVWGTGRPTREFLYVEDAAEGICRAMLKYDGPEPVNLGSGAEISVKNLAELICRFMGYTGSVKFDLSKPDGQPRRILDVTRAVERFGFRATTSLEAGLRKTIDWYNSTQL